MKYSRVYAEINLDAVEHNMEQMQKHLAAGAGMIGVVKADGYGHGGVPIAKTIDPYVMGFAVAAVEEAVILRRHGIGKMILVLGPVHESQYRDLVTYEIDSAVFQLDKAEALSQTALLLGKKAGVHIALDTGMSRIGYFPGTEAEEEIEKISRLEGIRIDGMFTHFAKADEKDKSCARASMNLFLSMASRLKERGISIPLLHCSNSAAIIDLKEAHMDAVRAGISIYGMYPSEEVEKNEVLLTPVMSLKSRISYIKTISKGTPVSYGGTFVAEKDMRVATIPVGYGDGYPRGLSGKASVLIRGRRAAVLGRVCMDQIMVDVTDIPMASEDDEVTLMGSDGNDRITAEELAELSGGFHYEIVCGIGKRVPRLYKKGGKTVGTKDYFDDRYEGFEGV